MSAGEESIDHLDFEPEGVKPEGVPGQGAQNEQGDQEEASVATDDGQAPMDTDPLAAAQTLAAERLTDLQRLNAEYVNYTKRAKREQELARSRGVEDVLQGVLPVLDDISRAQEAGELTGPFEAIATKLADSLKKFGVESFGAVGEVFDPAIHEALMHQDDPEAEQITVQHVIEIGYRIGDRVVRAARVAVVGPQG